MMTEMNFPARLLQRLEAIGRSLAAEPDALALLGLGSVGLELDRLDEYSDLDFFVIVRDGTQAAFLEDLTWLERVAPVAYHFQNNHDAIKLLFADGIFCEFAVLTDRELPGIPFAEGRIVWKRPEVPEAIGRPQKPLPSPDARTEAWLLGEALTNLYVGLGRYHRGEKLTAARFIQCFAVERVINLAARYSEAAPGYADPFGLDRRFEQRYGTAAAYLPSFMQGYDRTPQSAAAILRWLETHFEVNRAMAAAIRAWLPGDTDQADGN